VGAVVIASSEVRRMEFGFLDMGRATGMRKPSKGKTGQKKAIFECLYTSVCGPGDKQWEAEVFV